jgi:hypothetical protein
VCAYENAGLKISCIIYSTSIKFTIFKLGVSLSFMGYFITENNYTFTMFSYPVVNVYLLPNVSLLCYITVFKYRVFNTEFCRLFSDFARRMYSSAYSIASLFESFC